MGDILVQKFGGSSVATPTMIKNVAERIADSYKKGNAIVAVVSALGNTTNELLDLASKVCENPSEREVDVLISTGEQVSSALLTMAIHDLGLGAVSFTGFQVGIITDSTHTKAKIIDIDTSRIKDKLEKGKIVIVAGFQGMSSDKNITTLGRGGSDLTAMALAHSLGARMCEIYTDVKGVFTANPNWVDKARKLKVISYDEMLELASLGTEVLQARAVEFAKRYNVPIHVRSSFNDKKGTIISREVEEMEDIVVSGVTVNENEAKITVCDVPDKPGIASIIFKTLANEDINVDMIIQNVSRTGYTDVSFTIDKSDIKKTLAVTEKISKDIEAGEVNRDEEIAKISVVGIGMRSHSGIAAKMFEALASKEVNIEMISTSEIKISCVIQKKDAEKAVKKIHEVFELDENVEIRK